MTVDVKTLTDEELAGQSQDGSLVAFEELVGRFENRIHAFVYQSCRHEVDAREITQETFVRAFQALGQFDVKQKFAPWLFTIARRKCIDQFRARRPVAEGAPDDGADGNDPALLLEQQEEARNLWDVARGCLPEGQFQALWLYYVEEMNIAQVARALGKTQTHTKVILLRARRALAEKLPHPARATAVSGPARRPQEAMGGSL